MRVSLLVFPVLLTTCLSGCQHPTEDDHFGLVDDFQLTERSGRVVSNDDLKGKVWVAAFVFTRCGRACPQISNTMAQLQEHLVGLQDVLLVSFSVDPEHDTTEVLRDYASQYKADPNRWLFLTGEEKKIYPLIEKSFKLGVAQNQGTERTPGNEVMHSPKLVVVDRQGEKRGYYDGTDANSLAKLRKKIAELLREKY